MAHHLAALPRLQLQLACAQRRRVAAQAPDSLQCYTEALEFQATGPLAWPSKRPAPLQVHYMA